MLVSAVISLLAVTRVAQAAPSPPTAPIVTVASGTITGSSTNGTETFYGIPYAIPPIGPLRLRQPLPYVGRYPGGALNGTKIPARCPQLGANPLSTSTVPESEDCLTVNIRRPTGTAANAKLPVIFWIYGGSELNAFYVN